MKVYVVSRCYQPLEGNGSWSSRVERVFTHKEYAEKFFADLGKKDGCEDGYYDIDELELEGDFNFK